MYEHWPIRFSSQSQQRKFPFFPSSHLTNDSLLVFRVRCVIHDWDQVVQLHNTLNQSEPVFLHKQAVREHKSMLTHWFRYVKCSDWRIRWILSKFHRTHMISISHALNCSVQDKQCVLTSAQAHCWTQIFITTFSWKVRPHGWRFMCVFVFAVPQCG